METSNNGHINPEVVKTSTQNILHAFAKINGLDLGWLINNFRASGTLSDNELKKKWKAAEKAIDNVAKYLKEQAGTMK